jgi:hypothetical protein
VRAAADGVQDQPGGPSGDSDRRVIRLRRAGRVCASVTLLLGAVCVWGWIFDRSTMTFNTGLGMMVLGGSLL